MGASSSRDLGKFSPLRLHSCSFVVRRPGNNRLRDLCFGIVHCQLPVCEKTVSAAARNK